jgi:hypothetical protein
LRLVKSDKIRT